MSEWMYIVMKGRMLLEKTPHNYVPGKKKLWRRKFSCRSCRDSNSQPFDHESGALTNKLSRVTVHTSVQLPNLRNCHDTVTRYKGDWWWCWVAFSSLASFFLVGQVIPRLRFFFFFFKWRLASSRKLVSTL